MASPLSVDDLFTVGVSFDLLGGFMLGRGLLASSADIRSRSAMAVGFNPATMLSQISARADGETGLGSLGVGFLMQGAGYVFLIGGTTVATGAERAVLSVVLALALGGAALLALRRLHVTRVHRLAVAVARTDPETGQAMEFPDGVTLVALGRLMGYPFEPTGHGFPSPESASDEYSAYAKRHFGVERVSLP